MSCDFTILAIILMDNIKWFVNVEPGLHTWDKFNLNLIYIQVPILKITAICIFNSQAYFPE